LSSEIQIYLFFLFF